MGAELDSVRLQLVAQCESNGVADSIGVRTIGQYVAARTNSTSKGTNQDATLARWLRDFPLFSEALERRDLTVEHLQYVRSKLDNDRTHHALKDDQQFFADLGSSLDFKGFETACEYWTAHVDPDGEEPLDQLEKSGVNIKVGFGGRTTITINSDAVSGSAFARMIEHETCKIRKRDLADGIERTDGQRRHAAAFALAERGFRRQDGFHPIPLFTIVMSQTVAEWTLHKLANPKCHCEQCESVPVHPTDVDRRCELINGQPIHPLLVAAVLGLPAFDTPALRRYVMDAKSRILDHSYNARTAPEHLRTASHIEHRGQCSMPGRGVPHAWLQIDHVDPVDNGGETRLGNVEPKCEPDNLAKGATTGHTAWKDRPPSPRHRPKRQQDRSSNNDDDPDDDDSDRWF